MPPRSSTASNGCHRASAVSGSCRSAALRSGPGLNAPPGFAAAVIERLSVATGLVLTW